MNLALDCADNLADARRALLAHLFVVSFLALNGCATANTGEAELRSARAPIRVWTGCSTTFSIVHRIVTHDTPRQRDLLGKLTIRATGGDPSVIVLARARWTSIYWIPIVFLVPYRLGTTIAVVERGHVGGGVHTWHEGIESFIARGSKPGHVQLEASVDPDPEVPEGDGVPTVRATFRVDVPRPTAIKVADASWGDLAWETLLLRSDGLRLKVDVAPPLADLSEIPCTINVLTQGTLAPAHGTLPGGVDVKLDRTNSALGLGGAQVRITLTTADLVREGLIPPNPADGRAEVTTADYIGRPQPGQPVGSNYNDSNHFDLLSRGAGDAQRGLARTNNVTGIDGNINAAPPEASMRLSFMQAAGAEIVLAQRDGVRSEERLIQNQADALYFSGHGNHQTGGLSLAAGASFQPTNAVGHWSQELRKVFFAGCSVVDIKNYNRNPFNPNTPANSAASPGEKWMTTGPKLFFGYNWYAPLDDNVGNPDFTKDIVAAYFAYRAAGVNENWSWGKANKDLANGNRHDKVAGRPMNCCMIDLTVTPTEYWYFEAKPTLFGYDYTWTKKTGPPW